MNRGLSVAVIQHDIVWEDRSANLARLAPMILAAAEQGARLVVLTEMFSVGFSARTDVIQEPPDGHSTTFLVEQARRHDIWVLGSVCVLASRSGNPANVAVLAAPDGSIYRYSKRHLFSYSGEDDRMSAGDATLTVDIEGVSTTIFICYDLRFADDFWRLAPITDAYVVIANWPTARTQHWRTLLSARAIENQAWVIGSNRVGRGGNLDYSGDSLVVDPMGNVLADGAGVGEATLRATIDTGVVADVRSRYPFLADRRGPVPLDPHES